MKGSLWKVDAELAKRRLVEQDIVYSQIENMPKGRVSRVDVDFEHTRRGEVLDYIARKYGQENVCHIVTFGTMAAKMAIKDVGRALGYAPYVANEIAKLVPDKPGTTLDDAMDKPDFRQEYETNDDAKRIIDIAMRLEGCKRHSSQHACFDARTKVMTAEGEKNICDVRMGDQVLTHMGRFQTVVDTMVSQTKQVHQLNFAGLSQIKCTGNHPFYVRTYRMFRMSAPKWKDASDLVEGEDWCGIPICDGANAMCNRLQFDPENMVREVNFIWVRLLRHRVQYTKREMYNLSVLNDNSYTANGVAVHNCGYVVAPGKVDDYLPTSLEKDDAGNKALTCQVVMSEVEELSLLKMDLLGLKNMTVIHDVLKNIKVTRGIDMDYHDIPIGDRATYEMLRSGMTGGVFQLESAGMTRVVMPILEDLDEIPDDKLEDMAFERLIAAVALYRPGPMDYIPDYIAGIHNPASVTYDCPQEEAILKPTYGQIVFQEQVIQLVQVMAGYSAGRGDVVRKAMGGLPLPV